MYIVRSLDDGGTMIRDSLDDVLDRSAPAVRPATQPDLDAMIADASQSAPRTLRPRIAIVTGLAVVLASGGVGLAAAATDGFSWAPWAQEPIGAVQFSMTNGFQCELRFSEYTAGEDPAYVNEVNGILEHWYQSADVLSAVRAFVPARLEGLGPIELQEGETLETLPMGEAQHREWARQWRAWDLAVSDAEWQELVSHGIQPGDERFEGSERSGQIQCRDENNEPYVPEAGS
jgi:hypothetical protein